MQALVAITKSPPMSHDGRSRNTANAISDNSASVAVCGSSMKIVLCNVKNGVMTTVTAQRNESSGENSRLATQKTTRPRIDVSSAMNIIPLNRDGEKIRNQ